MAPKRASPLDKLQTASTSSPALKKKSTPKRPPTSTTPQPQPSSSEFDSETEYNQPAAAADSKENPFASKAMEKAPKKNCKLQSSATPSRSGTKPPKEKKDRGKKVTFNNEVVAAESGKKAAASEKLSQRLWSDDDEIVILNGMNEFWVDNGTPPCKNMGAFLDFIKKFLHVDVSRSQLTDKIWRLKKKYQKNVSIGKKW